MGRSRLITEKFPGLLFLSIMPRGINALYGLLRRSARALRFPHQHGTETQWWMLSSRWKGWIGCENCQEGGPNAPCGGKAACHGYLNGCGCVSCIGDDVVNARECV